MERIESICMSEYSYQENLLYTSKESEVYKAVNKNHPNAMPFIFKGYPESYLSDSQKERKLMQELNTLWKLHGKENILQIITQHSRDKKVFIITEFCEGGTLAQQIKKEGKFGEQKSIAYIQQIIKGYSHIFEAHLIHRNLEPSSIFSTGLQLKIGDFSDSIKQSEDHLATFRQQIIGNIHFQPFEALSAYRYSVKSDVYSIGAILLCMLTGKPPYEGSNKNQILSNMQNNSIKTLISSFKSQKLKLFLEKTLENNENMRMSPQQLIIYDFESMPQLKKLKLYTFDDRDSILVQQQIGANKSSKKHLNGIKESIRERQLQQSMKALFKNFEISQKKFSAIDLKISDEDELSKFYRDREISIFIPTKMDLTPPDEQMFDNLGLQRIDSIEKRPSEGLPLKKRAGTNKEITNNTYNDLLKSQVFSKNKHKNETTKHLTINVDQETMKPAKGDPQLITTTNVTQKASEKVQTLMTTNANETVVPSLQFNQEKVTNRANQPSQNKPSTYQAKLTTERSNIKGPFTLRGRQNIVLDVSKRQESKSSVIAEWFISQIDMFRLLNRVGFKINKHKPQLNELSVSLQALKFQILKDIKALTHLSRQESALFQSSAECPKINEIVSAYQSKISGPMVNFQGYQRLNSSILGGISLMFSDISTSSDFKQEQIKLLDYLITVWQLVKLLKRNSLEHFHSRSKIGLIIDSKETKLTMAHFLSIYERMKTLKLI